MSDRINLDVGVTVARKFRARITDTGTLRPEEAGRWLAWLQANKGKTVDVSISRAKRSVKANAYWWGVVVPLAADLLSREAKIDPPIPNAPVHYRLVEAFGASRETSLGRVAVQSSDMDSAEFADLVSKTREWLLHRYGVVCPTPDDYWEAA